MILFPAIDLKNNMCVRLVKGDMDTAKIYHENPLDMAKHFVLEGASYLHVVDLNQATDGQTSNLKSIQDMLKTIDIPIQVGGGIRTMDQAASLLALGVTRVIVGTMAIEQFEVLKTLASTYPNQVIVSIDAINRMVATHGWQKQSNMSAIDLIHRLESIGIDTIVYTDISKDGMLLGPNFDDYQYLQSQTSLNIIASGGIASLDDLIKLKQMNIYGAIIGKALYESRFTLKEAITCLQNASSPV